VFGLILGYFFMVAVSWLSHSTERHKAERRFSHLQLLSAGAYSLGHGTNDAQKTMGIIAALLVASGKKEWTVGSFHFLGTKHELAMWIILSCHAVMALGTLFGSWRIVKIMGSRIIPHLRPIGGFSAELASATTIGLATLPRSPFPPRTLSQAGFLELGQREAGPQDDGNGHSASFTLGSLRFLVRHWLARSAIG
jgi:PiT family inorganic phosphate transporter